MKRSKYSLEFRRATAAQYLNARTAWERRMARRTPDGGEVSASTVLRWAREFGITGPRTRRRIGVFAWLRERFQIAFG